MPRTLLRLLILSAWVVPSSVLAQTDGVGVEPGDTVRVSASTAAGVFVVEDLTRDSLFLRGPVPSVEALGLSLHSLTKLEVRRARSRGAGALRGAGIGLLIGAGVGALIGIAHGSDPPGIISFSAGEKALMFGVPLGGAGVVLGAVAGHGSPGERWERMDPHQRLGFSRTGNGGFALAYSYRF